MPHLFVTKNRRQFFDPFTHKLLNSGLITGFTIAGSYFFSAFSTCSVRDTSGRSLSCEVRAAIAFFQSFAQAESATSVCFADFRFTPMALTWHAFSQAPQ